MLLIMHYLVCNLASVKPSLMSGCAVRVMDCDGEGAMSTIITGLEWILENLELPAVVLMSIGGDATLLLDQACEALVTAGAVVVVAAGNDDEGEKPRLKKYARFHKI